MPDIDRLRGHATRLVVADPQSQKAVAAFLASFIFAIVGVIALGTGRHGPAGRMALFVCAVGVLAWVVVALAFEPIARRVALPARGDDAVAAAPGRAAQACAAERGGADREDRAR